MQKPKIGSRGQPQGTQIIYQKPQWNVMFTISLSICNDLVWIFQLANVQRVQGRNDWSSYSQDDQPVKNNK